MIPRAWKREATLIALVIVAIVGIINIFLGISSSEVRLGQDGNIYLCQCG